MIISTVLIEAAKYRCPFKVKIMRSVKKET